MDALIRYVVPLLVDSLVKYLRSDAGREQVAKARDALLEAGLPGAPATPLDDQRSVG